MTTFIAIETLRGNRKVAWIQDEFAIPFTMGENDLKERIKNLKAQGLNTFGEEKALNALEEVNEQYDI